MEREVQKFYGTIVRGIPKEKEGLIDPPLESKRSNRLQESQTKYKVLAEADIPFNSTGR